MEKTQTPRKVPAPLWESFLRRLRHFYWRFVRGMTLGVRGLVIDDADRILLVQHGYVRGWHLPGGGVETGETTLKALKRELAEEGNIRLTGAPRLHGIFFSHHASRRDHVAVFVIDDFEQDGPHIPNREIVAAAFFPLDALPDDTTAGTRARIAEVFGGAPVTEHW
jgi:ADP-ribose pyrophosphatase YjhB (NUDIX family)